MNLPFVETEISRTFRFSFEQPLVAPHPNYGDLIEFNVVTVTLSAVWDRHKKNWVAKRDRFGGTPTIQMRPIGARFKGGFPKGVNKNVPMFSSYFEDEPEDGSMDIRLDRLIPRFEGDSVFEDIRSTVVGEFYDNLPTNRS